MSTAVVVFIPTLPSPVTLTLPELFVVAVMEPAATLALSAGRVGGCPMPAPVKMPVLKLPVTLTFPELVVVAAVEIAIAEFAPNSVKDVPKPVAVKMPKLLPGPLTLMVPVLFVVALPMTADVWMPKLEPRVKAGLGPVGGWVDPVTLMVPELVVVALPANVAVWMPKPPPVLMTEPVLVVVA
ncbi:MAG TPA: hypothetical protein VN065_06850, partial [Bradyrhizobium sp.]|nr:hypothetical protein [Bradyrhizobium sp.]